jgi:putative transposase
MRRSLACTNIIQNMNGTVRRVCRNVKHWQDASKGFRWLKAYRQLLLLRGALATHQTKHTVKSALDR